MTTTQLDPRISAAHKLENFVYRAIDSGRLKGYTERYHGGERDEIIDGYNTQRIVLDIRRAIGSAPQSGDAREVYRAARLRFLGRAG